MLVRSIFRIVISVLGLVFFTLIQKSSIAQTEQTINFESLKKTADSVYGSSHELVNGELYYQSNLYAKGSPFYRSNDWLKGSVSINGTKHQNVFLKYNIETDQLILRPSLKNGMSTAIVLNTPFVESFYLLNNLFINSEQYKSKELKSAFVQEIYKGDFSFLASYKVLFITDYNDKSPYGRYSDVSKNYFIFQNGNVTKIASKKALTEYFEANKKDVRKLIKKEKIRFKKANPGQWRSLMKSIDELISTSAK